ncbi:RNA-binding protein [Candidatus Scalindua japonica]|uniref:RNA-binding protein n=1 Tax=Candidatus Scalindua japonica TaxID=1284222 RepID=A0A286TWS3_9BACT|nr:hypothetical protein [Candidatus Scalindua japonica]GAX60322.1 RNA-binding protein [Candidatus Scalindua japonica]
MDYSELLEFVIEEYRKMIEYLAQGNLGIRIVLVRCGLRWANSNFEVGTMNAGR